VIHSEPYSEISGNEFYPANGYSRGFLSVRFEHATLGPIVVYSTHVAAFPAAYPLRMSHVRELGLHMRKFVPADELVFAMGDFNAGPYYKTDVWSLPNNGAEPAWFANTLSYPMLMHYAGVTDLAVRGRSAMKPRWTSPSATRFPTTQRPRSRRRSATPRGARTRQRCSLRPTATRCTSRSTRPRSFPREWTS
jgi:hypothetical protein